jgi:hypothetical protein
LSQNVVFFWFISPPFNIFVDRDAFGSGAQFILRYLGSLSVAWILGKSLPWAVRLPLPKRVWRSGLKSDPTSADD